MAKSAMNDSKISNREGADRTMITYVNDRDRSNRPFFGNYLTYY